MQGPAVLQLQRALNRLGHLSSAALQTGPGVFGPQTESAVKSFQRSSGISAVGLYGPQTRAALQRALSGGPVTGPSTTPSSNQTGFRQLWPSIQRYGRQYGADPKLLAAIVAQESSFRNLRVHRDGTGHGLIGLDDNGLLPSFERWSGTRVGRGRNARIIPPDQQIHFLAREIGRLTRKYDSGMAAARAWHRGESSAMWDRRGDLYARLIQNHQRRLF